MPPKGKPPAKAAGSGAPKPADATGLYVECDLPLWVDPADAQKEDWGSGKGDYTSAPAVVDPESLFNDPAMDAGEPWPVPVLQQHNKGWRRPCAIFSPFKPVVVKTTLADCPYEGELPPIPESEPGSAVTKEGSAMPAEPPATPEAAAGDGGAAAAGGGAAAAADAAPQLRTREEVVAEYRAVKKLKAANPVPEVSGQKKGRGGRHCGRGGGGAAGVGAGGGVDARRGGQEQTPCFMQVFNSCLAVLTQVQAMVPRGQYLWELIYPQASVQNGIKLPQYNPYGKYVVRIFAKGAWRRLVIDDRLPTDIFGQSLLSITEVKEIWPALLAKALLRVLGPGRQDLLFTDPLWVMHALLPGYIPQKLSTVSHTATLLTLLNGLFEEQGGGGAGGGGGGHHQQQQRRSLQPQDSEHEPPGDEDEGGGDAADATPPSVPAVAGGSTGGGGGGGRPGGSKEPEHLVIVAIPHEVSVDEVRARVVAGRAARAAAAATTAASEAGDGGGGEGHDAEEAARQEEEEAAEVAAAVETERKGLEQRYRAVGLHTSQVYLLRCARPLVSPPTTMLRLSSPFLAWSGSGSYADSEVWTEQMEQQLCFRRSERMDNQNTWTDAWMTWSDFATYFPHAVVLRPASGNPRFAVHRTLRWSEEAVALLAATQPPHGTGVAGAAPAAAVPDGALSDDAFLAGSVLCRWLYAKSTEPTHVLVAYTGEAAPEPAGADGTPALQASQVGAATGAAAAAAAAAPVRCTVRAFDWGSSLSLKPVARFEAQAPHADSLLLTLPACPGGRAYSVECTGLTRSDAVAFMSPQELTWVDGFDEVLSKHLSITSWTEHGEVEAHAADALHIWFKKVLTVRAPCTAQFSLETLPPGVAPPPPADADKKGGKKGGKDAAGAAGSAAAPAATVLEEGELQAALEAHAAKRIDLAAWVRLVVLNMDTGERVSDFMGVVPPVAMQPNRHGYMLLAYATPREAYPPAGYALTVSADAPLERAVAVGARDSFARKGSYAVNAEGRLFKAFLVPQEATNLTAVLYLTAARPVGFTLRVLRGDDVVWEVKGWTGRYRSRPGPSYAPDAAAVAAEAGGAAAAASTSAENETLDAEPVVIENVSLPAADVKGGGGGGRYSIACWLDEGCADAIKEVAHGRLREAFRRTKEEKKGAALARRAEVLRILEEKGGGPDALEDALHATSGSAAAAGATTSSATASASGGEGGSDGGRSEGGEPAAAAEAQIPAGWAVAYSLQILSSTARLSLEDDVSPKERAAGLRAGWVSREATLAAAAAASSPGGGAKDKGKQAKGGAGGDDAAGRHERAQKSRQQYMDCADGVFLPRKVAAAPTPAAAAAGAGEAAAAAAAAASVITQPEDEPLMRNLPPGEVARVVPASPEEAVRLLEDAVYAECVGVVTAAGPPAADAAAGVDAAGDVGPSEDADAEAAAAAAATASSEEAKAAASADEHYTVETNAGEVVEGLRAEDLEVLVGDGGGEGGGEAGEEGEAPPPKLGQGARVAIKSRRRRVVGGRLYVVCSRSEEARAGGGGGGAAVSAAAGTAEWANIEEEHARQRRAEEAKLQRQGEARAERMGRVRAVHVAYLTHHKASRDAHFASLKAQGLMAPAAPPQEAAAGKAGGKKGK